MGPDGVDTLPRDAACWQPDCRGLGGYFTGTHSDCFVLTLVRSTETILNTKINTGGGIYIVHLFKMLNDLYTN